MAKRNLEVVVSVKKASADRKLKETSKTLRRTGKAARTAGTDFKGLTKTLFTTTAFIGTFTRAFSKLFESINKGANLDRLQTQFERVLGPTGTFIDNLKNSTTTAVDQMAAMKSGIDLANSGIVNSSSQAANIISMAATAAKLAHVDISQGIKRVTQFFKGGEVAQLEFLNVLKRTNPELIAQLSVLKQAGGVMGDVISTQRKLTLGTKALKAATRGQMFAIRDLSDMMTALKSTVEIFRGRIGRFLGKALKPLIVGMTKLLDTVGRTVENLEKNEKHIVFLTKSIVVATGAVTGLVGALGALKLASMVLGSVGFGLPKLIALGSTIAITFLSITQNAESLTDKLKVFGGFIKGVYQMVTTLDEETGIAKIDRDVKKLLQNKGIFQFARNVARSINVVGAFARDVGKTLIGWGKSALDIIQSISGAFRDLLGMDTGEWSTSLLNDMEGIRGTLVKLTAGFAAFLGIKKLFGGVLSKIPGIGRLFGGRGGMGGRGPSGTATDPIYTVGTAGVAGGLLGGKKGRGIFSTFGRFFRMKFGGIFRKTGTLISALIGKFLGTKLGSVLSRAGSFIKDSMTVVGRRFGRLAMRAGLVGTALAAAGAAGFTLGKILTNLFPTLKNLGPALYDMVYGKQEQTDFEKATSEKAILKHRNMLRERVGKEPLTMKEHLATKSKSATIPGGASPSTAKIPKMPEGELEKIDLLGESLKEVSGAQRREAKTAIEQAYSSTSEGGATMTPEEWRRIFSTALDSSRTGKALVDEYTNPKSEIQSGSRRGD